MLRVECIPAMPIKTNSPARHLTQTHTWMQFQEALGRKTFEDSGTGWSYSAALEESEPVLGRSSTRLYVPYGPIAKDSGALETALESLRKLAVSHKASYVRVDPYPYFKKPELKRLGLRKNLRDSQPNMTWILDLGPSEDELLANMTSLNRRIWRRRAEFGLSFEEDSSPKAQKDFDKFMYITGKRTSSIPRSYDYMATLLQTFGENCGIVFCLHGGKRLAGALFVDDVENKTRYYLYAGSVEEAKKHSCSSALLCYLIFGAKNKGLKHLDFFGIIPENIRDHPYTGYSDFKRSFGGRYVGFSGTWELPIARSAHTAIRLGRRVAKVIKKVRR